MSESERPFSLLLVDDDPIILASLKKIFSKDDYLTHSAGSGEKALAILAENEIDVALTDLMMPGMDGLALLKELKKAQPSIGVIMLTGHGGVKEAVEAIKLGADDFMQKPFQPEGLRARVTNLHKIWELERENRTLREQIEFQGGFEHLVGISGAMVKLKNLIRRIGNSDVPVLVQGETGTGKELVAQAVHNHSPRLEKNFVPVDCGALTESIMESELFGHVKGAFTGAHDATLGLIRTADKGTLFLDEIGDLPLPMQVKLLRTIQQREVRPVGSNKSYSVDIRIVAATNRDLKEEIGQGNFREDLYYRLNAMIIEVPPLRDRKEDIPLLSRFFIKRFESEFSPVKEISREALARLTRFDWPGNVRELENVIRRSVAMGMGGSILPEDLPAEVSGIKGEIGISGESPGPGDGGVALPDDSLAAYEKAAILNALDKSGGNRKEAARILGIGEATLYRKIGKYRIQG